MQRISGKFEQSLTMLSFSYQLLVPALCTLASPEVDQSISKEARLYIGSEVDQSGVLSWRSYGILFHALIICSMSFRLQQFHHPLFQWFESTRHKHVVMASRWRLRGQPRDLRHAASSLGAELGWK